MLYLELLLIKITVNRSANNSARCYGNRALLNLIAEHDSLSCNFRFHACCLEIASRLKLKPLLSVIEIRSVINFLPLLSLSLGFNSSY